MSLWQPLERELTHWHTAGLTPTLWWRDDDVSAPSSALEQLLRLSEDYATPMLLAAIPARLDTALYPALAPQRGRIWACQHGYAHLSHSQAPERKCEYPASRDLAAIRSELQRGRAQLEARLREVFFPAFVPPWNRVGEAIPELLAELDYRGFSALGDVDPASPLATQHVHVDLIDWRARACRAPEQLVQQLCQHLQARRGGERPLGEVTGFMTHHLDHDEPCWQFCRDLLQCCQQQSAQWLSAPQLFGHS